MNQACLPILRHPGFSDRFERLDAWLQKAGASQPFQWCSVTELNSTSQPVLLPLHCGGFYQFEKEEWLRERLGSLPMEIRDSLASGKLVLLLDGSGEGISPFRRRLENIEQTLVKFRIKRAPIYLTSAIDGAVSYRRGCYRETMTPILHVIYFPIQFFQIIAGFLQNQEAQSIVDNLLSCRKAVPKDEKIFLSFNYMPRWWRYALMVHLYENNWLGRGHISFFGEHIAENWKKDTELDESRIAQILRNHGVGVNPEQSVRAVNALAPMTLDVGTEADRFNIAYQPEALHLYQETFFSVVTESDFAAHTGVRFSEKSVKPLVMGHPMLLIGTAGVVNALERLGYRLSGGLFKHEYDEIGSDAVRLRMALRELERVLRLNRYQFQKAWEAELDLIDHNIRFSREAVSKNRLHASFLGQIGEALRGTQTLPRALGKSKFQ